MKKGILFILMATILFSSMECVLKLIAGQLHPLQVTWLRFTVGALILLPLALNQLKKRRITLAKRDWVYFSSLGVFGIVISMTLYQLAVINAEASVVAVVFSSNPIFVIPLSALMLGTKIHWYHLTALALDVLGILFIINPFNLTISAAGLAFSLLAPIFFALYSTMGKKRAEMGGIVNTCFGFLCGCAELGMLMLLSHIPAVADAMPLALFRDIPFFSGLTLNNLPHMFYVSVFVTGIGFASYFLAIEHTSPVTASLTFFLKPVIAPFFAKAILGEQMSALQVVGVCIIFIGSMFNFIPSLKQHKMLPEKQAAG